MSNSFAADVKVSPVKPMAPMPSHTPSKAEMEADTKIVLKAIADRYEKLKNWEAAFTQETYSVGLGTSTFSEGRLTFLLPNKFRFSLISPEKSDFISNGKNAWMIQYPHGPAKPAYVRHFKDLTKIELDRYLLLLKGVRNADLAPNSLLNKAFVMVGKSQGDDLILEISPRQASEISKITLNFKRGIPTPQSAVLLDTLGNTTTIRITNVLAIKDPEEGSIQLRLRPDYPKGSKIESF